MSQEDRRYTGDVTVFSVGGISILGTFKNTTLKLTTTMQESRAAKDSWRASVPRISAWDIDIDKAVEAEDGIRALTGTKVEVVFTSSATGGMSLSGSAWIKDLTLAFPDSDGQTQAIALEGYGEPTLSNT